ncbi:ABC transporter substrate-binding protein [Haloferax larsenii]|uniref:ABC-type nitrate/sulfonate/bicarbonate transport system, substrate-binding protein n=1 Tax=Haloferax larsenii TaxID=302484 RepID=A0A1H7NMV5_HALLR|nr:ABC transporter substrate-binding protein [Haloferax larsenii]SEL24328.1 ABC-type nitrate/sulfonate/bicarbonate transport system, substrate-binding protein [Haloferax larsenii]
MPVRDTHANRRDVLKATGTAVAAGSLAGCLGSVTGGGSSTVSITLGHGIASEEPLWLMDAMPDILDHWGSAYEAEFKAFPANNQRLQAFQAGELQAGTSAAVTAIFSTNKGLPLTVVANITQEREDTFHEKFLARPDSGMDGLNKESLEGKKVGICAFKSWCDLWAQSAIREVGLVPDEDVELVKVPFPSMGEAVSKGQVDTAIFPPVFEMLGKQKHGLKPIFSVIDTVGWEHDLMELWFSTQFIEQNPDVVEKFLEDYSTAVDYYNQNTKESKRAIHDAGYVQTPKETYVSLPNYTHSVQPLTESLKKINQLVADMGWIEEPVEIDNLYNLDYLP